MARLAPTPVATPARADAPARLADAVAARLAQGFDGTEDYVERIEVETEEIDLLAWLAAQPHALKCYWQGRGDRLAIAGVGAADQISGPQESTLERLHSRLDALGPSMRYVGGLRFDSAQASAPEWEAFASARFVLPRVELTVSGGQATLAAHLVLPRDVHRPDDVLAEIRALQEPFWSWSDAPPLPIARTDAPDRAAWCRSVTEVLRAIAETSLDKAVLARRAAFDFDEPLDPFALARRLFETTPTCSHFFVQPSPGTAFVGASPERLFRRDGEQLWSEAVAGTRPRSGSAPDDAALRDELLRSEKDQREHGAVRDYLRAVLAPFCGSLDLDDEASEMRLARGRHLYSGLRATLRPGTRSLDLLRALHPTPAVGGTPTDEALRLIHDLEPFDRGWYAGPVGWVGRDAAEFAVGIRSGLVEQRPDGARLSLYSGAGIVRGSDPDAEWVEVEGKLSPFLHLFNGER